MPESSEIGIQRFNSNYLFQNLKTIKTAQGDIKYDRELFLERLTPLIELFKKVYTKLSTD